MNACLIMPGYVLAGCETRAAFLGEIINQTAPLPGIKIRLIVGGVLLRGGISWLADRGHEHPEHRADVSATITDAPW